MDRERDLRFRCSVCVCTFSTVQALGSHFRYLHVADQGPDEWAEGLREAMKSLIEQALNGLDFGDDDGLMLGIGGQYDISPAFFMRVEYVIRDDIDSFQFNLLYQFK